MTLHEPAVALSDFALAIECGAFAAWLVRRSRTPIGLAFAALFAASAVAALLGGITHGFLPDQQTLAARLVWSGTLAAIGIAGFACWVVGALLLLPPRGARVVAVLAGLVFIGYLAVILFVSRSFTVAVADYAPASAFLLIAFGLAFWRQRTGYLLAGVAGVLLSFVAAAIQQAGIALHPGYLDHNTLYHLVQALAFLLLFLAARGLVRSKAGLRVNSR
jgi:Family of unknown function (DUF6962)